MSRSRARNLRQRYKITEEQWDSLFDFQGRRCGVCRDPSPAGYWHVDHDHATGVNRAILCRRCNLALGHAKESPARLLALAEYVLRHHPERAIKTFED